MKTNKIFQLLTLAICAVMFAFVTGCEGPAGPAGADGANGADGADGINGTNGSDGTDGVDGNAVCLECHNVTKKSAVSLAYEESTHAMSNVQYDGRFTYQYASDGEGRKSCAPCHSNEGFVETQYTGYDSVRVALVAAQRIQCTTCHSFHESLDFENEPNSALRTNTPVELAMYDDGTKIDFEDNSNLCANCHQPRTAAPTSDGDDFMVTSKYYGPHHGPQATVLSHIGGYELGTGFPVGDNAHAASSCVGCHMDESDHSFDPALAACNTTDCHDGGISSVTDNSRQNTIKTLMTVLQGELKTAGLLDDTDHAVPGTYGIDSAGSLYNYLLIMDDRSNGIHSFPYVEKLLNNSINYFQD